MGLLNRIDARVREIEENFGRSRGSVGDARAATVEVELSADLGRMEVTAAGEPSHVGLEVEEPCSPPSRR